jgi:glycosyltransferase involved in cell wall biosynthesis
MIKILGLALYGPLAASTRYRLSQYVLGLNSLGIDLQIRFLLGDDYLRLRFNGGKIPFKSIIKDVLTRFGDLSLQNKYNAIILHCELFPLMPGWLESLLLDKPYIYDFDDALYLKYQTGRMGFASPILGKKFNAIISGAAGVTAGNQFLADYSKKLNNNTKYFPTVVDTNKYIPMLDNRGVGVFTIGWIGSPSTAPYLDELVEPLSLLGLEGDVRFIVIGGKAPYIPNIIIDEIVWSEESEIDLINSFDVGVMPLPDNEWTRGKCAFKLIQYMACALPVIASAVGANIDLVHKECGILVTSSKEWIEALRIIRDRANTRLNMGEVGRDRVLKHYSLKENLPVLAGELLKITSLTS